MNTQSLALEPSRCACGASPHAHETHDAQAHDERRLVADLIAGDNRAWREFEQRYARNVQRCITSVTSRFSSVVGADDVREIYATFCIRLWEGDKHKLRTFDPERGYSLKSWFGMLAVQTTYEFLRKRKRETGRDRKGGEGVMGAASPDPYEQCWERQRSELAGSLIHQFSERDREFFRMYYDQGCEPEQIAERMGISVKTVYTKKHKLMSRLVELAGERRLAA
jgi:RNA polymerase sigma-70 factor (ECF subfamily)